MAAVVSADPAASLDFNYHSINDDIYERPVNFMASKKLPHSKDETIDVQGRMDPGIPYDFTKFQEYLNENGNDRGESPDHNRIKRRAKRRRNRGRKNHRTETVAPTEDNIINSTAPTEGPAVDLGETDARRSSKSRKRKQNKLKKKKMFEVYESNSKQFEANFVEMPKDLYQAHLRPGVIFRIHMSEAILKMQYRNYGEDKDESVIEADVEYLRLTRKVISDEITKFEDLKWLTSWFINRTQLVREHICNTRYYSVGVPPTMFTSTEEYMKEMCLFDSVYIDHIPYVIGEDGSLMAAVAPPVLHCDAATCTSVPFIDSVMFDERLPRTNVRTVTRCQASCRAHCKNDPDCLKRCSDRCLRAE